MTKKSFLILLTAALAVSTSFAATKASSVTQHHITWTFDKEYQIGQFVNGDWWVVGPVNIVGITNDLSDMKFADPETPEVSGSMVNPIIERDGPRFSDTRQGYDERLQQYVPELNAAYPNGKPVSKDNPLVLKPVSSLVSTVSWLWRSEEEKEEGAPRVPASGKHMRPTLRAAAVLTVVDKPPPEGSFRPAYAGTEKRTFNVKQIQLDRLANLDPVESLTNAPYEGPFPGFNYSAILTNVSIPQMTYALSHLWLDHIPHWYGGEAYHPSLNMPNYGREMCWIIGNSLLALNTDWSKIDGKPDKMPLLINMLQFGIDLAGIADAGGFWGADGGHLAGRKPAILFAGLLLDDKHMKNVGHWKTNFQDNEQTFYVTEADVEATNAPGVADKVKTGFAPFTKEMIGMPEYRFRPPPSGDGGGNAAWRQGDPYRFINNGYIPIFALTFTVMEDGRKLFNHEAYFDYADRIMDNDMELMSKGGYDRLSDFATDMWQTHRAKFPSTFDSKRWKSETIMEHITNPPPKE